MITKSRKIALLALSAAGIALGLAGAVLADKPAANGTDLNSEQDSYPVALN